MRRSPSLHLLPWLPQLPPPPPSPPRLLWPTPPLGLAPATLLDLKLRRSLTDAKCVAKKLASQVKCALTIFRPALFLLTQLTSHTSSLDKDDLTKVNLLLTLFPGVECRCGGLFCHQHRYSDEHHCTFDYRQLGAEEIRKNNPVVVGEKIQKI